MSEGDELKGPDWTRLVFRLRRIPPTVLRKRDVAALLSRELHDVTEANIHIFSLASALDGYDAGGTPRVAILKFRKAPSLLDTRPQKEGWIINVAGRDEGLILDHHFRNMTPLVEPISDHSFEYVISRAVASLG